MNTLTLDGKVFVAFPASGSSCVGCYFDHNPGCHRVACSPDKYSKRVVLNKPEFELTEPIIWKEKK